MSHVSQKKSGNNMVYNLRDTEKVSRMFDDWDETLIWSCLQGIMGNIYVTDKKHPASAMAVLGDFTFFAGEPDAELVSYKPEWRRQEFMIMVPQNEDWAHLIEQQYGEKAKAVARYAIKKEPGIFDREKLKQMTAALPEDYELCMIDSRLYEKCREEKWCRDFVSQFADYEKYKELGLGVVILHNGAVVAGASSYSRYREGIEIEIDTREEYRRKGLATICGAKLILECLERSLYPGWDAQNKWSLALAEKLGYHFSHEYKAYEIWGY